MWGPGLAVLSLLFLFEQGVLVTECYDSPRAAGEASIPLHTTP
jgi:hypothetical protein